MQTKIEGLLISKTPFQDRHIIGHLLLRSGRRVSVLFYGGQGGGKKQKGSNLEIGFMLQVELGRSRSTSDMYRAKEWQTIWVHEKIRLNHKAYYFLCFIVEVLQKLSIEDNLHDQHRDVDTHDEGLFRVASNAIFHLEKSVAEGSFQGQGELIVFLGKLLIEQGVFPIREHCVFCDAELEKLQSVFLVPDHGGFACRECVNHEELSQFIEQTSGRELWECLGVVANQKFSQIVDFNPSNISISKSLLNYFNFQFHFRQNDFKSLAMLL